VSTFLLIRHAEAESTNHTLNGRMPGVHLTETGQMQAVRLAERIRTMLVTAVYSSPLERARDTAAAISKELRLPVALRDGLAEVDCGDWSGQSFAELSDIPAWRWFNTFRSGTQIPGGEHILKVQCRVIEELNRIRHDHPEQTVAVVSHADVLRPALGYYLGIPLDLLLRIEIAPASLSVVRMEPHGPTIVSVNDTSHLAEPATAQSAVEATEEESHWLKR